MSTPLPPKTVADLMRVTGLGDVAVRAAIRTGQLPGYYVGRGSRGQYVIPGEAFAAFCAGTWVPQLRPLFTESIRPLPRPEDMVKQRAG
jgi:hypothetical protein